jgi:hypothetical protein
MYLVLIMPSSCSLDSDTVTKHIDKQYYFTYYTSGLFATTSTYFHINIYQHRNWWLDREIADIVLPVSGSLNDTLDVSYQQERLRVFIQQELKIDTLIPEGQSIRIN